jgi:uncharacterized membrane protein YfcA
VTLEPAALLAVTLVVFVGYTVFGATGFGASPITIPVLAHVLPLPCVLALIPFTLLGLILGVRLLVRLPRAASLLALGAFVCAYAVHVMLRRGTPRPLARWWAAPAGMLGGLVGALFGMGGPPYVVYITGRVRDATAQRATISQMVILNVGLRVLTFALAGLLASPTLWTTALLLLPMAWAGLWVGHRVHLRLAPATLARLIAAALFVTGASLIVRAL